MTCAFYGLASGWLAALLFARSNLVIFAYKDPGPGDILNLCTLVRYPKEQDYFWFGMMLMAGWAGSALALALRGLARKRGWPKQPIPWTFPAGCICMALGFILGFSEHYARSFPAYLLFAGTLALPWFSEKFRSPDGPPRALDPVPAQWRSLAPWAVFAGALSLLWMFDPYLRMRFLDTLHEGTLLAYVQSCLSGQRPGIDFQTEYGPFYICSLFAWMDWWGMTVVMERVYFFLVQAMGGAIFIFVLGGLGASQQATAIGTVLTLFLTTISPVFLYGWANALRSALPLFAIWAVWRHVHSPSRALLAAAGAVLGTAFLYSPEYAFVGATGCAILFAVRGKRESASVLAGDFAVFAGSGTAFALAILAVIYGSRTPSAIHSLVFDSYFGSRMNGSVTRPFPAFIWLVSIDRLVKNLLPTMWTLNVWIQGLIACAAGAWLLGSGASPLRGRRLLVLALVPASLLAQLPVLVRPTAQTASSAPFELTILVIILDDLLERGRSWRILSGFVCALLLLQSVNSWAPGPFAMIPRALNPQNGPLEELPGIPRLGGLRMEPRVRKLLQGLVPPVGKITVPGEVIFVSDFRFPIVSFLADRPALSPYPVPILGASPRGSAAILDSLQKQEPRVVVWSETGLEVHFRQAFPDLYRYILANYRPYREYDGTYIQLRRE